jgi:hypothetical protein
MGSFFLQALPQRRELKPKLQRKHKSAMKKAFGKIAWPY